MNPQTLRTPAAAPVAAPAAALAAVLAASFAAAGPLAAQEPEPGKLFAIEVEHTRLPAISQGRTGTCWAFSTTSFLESELERMHGTPVDLSELHTVFYAYIEKARRYVRLHGKTQFDEGGLCHDVMYVIDKYGAVPQQAFSGLCEGDRGHDHAEMVEILKVMVEKIATGKRPSGKWEAALRGVLEGYLGRVPDAIAIAGGSGASGGSGGRALSPREYTKTVLKLEPKDYRQLASLASQPYWQPAELLVPDNWMRHAGYWNVPVTALMDRLDAALRAGFTAAIDIDISEPTTRSFVWTLPEALERKGAVTDRLRQQMFDDRSTTDDHLMHVVGLARHADGRTFYLTKDSYGQRGPFRGHRMISRNYLMAKMLSFMVHKDALGSDLTRRFE